MERMLYEAAVEGNIFSLIDLLQNDALILDRNIVTSYGETPLHIAAMLGHLEFVCEILRRKPELSGTLDSRRSSPLHLASAKGYTEIVRALLSTNPKMCFAIDRDGNNPLHLAALKGRVSVLEELVRAQPDAARLQADNGGTILHLCVQNNQLEALKFLVANIPHVQELVNCKDNQGNTILHLAVADKQIETINFLLSSTTIELNALNVYGFTAMDILAQSRRDTKDMDIADSLQGAGSLKSKDIQLRGSKRYTDAMAPRVLASSNLNYKRAISISSSGSKKNSWEHYLRRQEHWLEEQRNSLMVVAVLIATMAFQAGVNPPGGGLGKDTINNSTVNSTSTIKVGGYLLRVDKKRQFWLFLGSNTTSFISSLSVILLLVSGLTLKSRLVMWILIVIMWIAITTIAATYVYAIVFLLADATTPSQLSVIIQVAGGIILFWVGLMGLLLLGHFIRLIFHLIRMLLRCLWRLIKCCV